MAVGRINRVAGLTGFSYEKMYGRFAGTKKTGRKKRGDVIECVHCHVIKDKIKSHSVDKVKKW